MHVSFFGVVTTRCLYQSCYYLCGLSHYLPDFSFKSVSDFGLFLSILPYFGKMKQVTKVTFLVKEQNVSVISTDVSGIL